MQLANASATSMNFIGFEELKGQGAPELLFNQIYIEPNLPQSTGKFNHAAAGFVPGQQHYLKQKRAIWNRSGLARALALQGYQPSSGFYDTMRGDEEEEKDALLRWERANPV